MAPGDEPVAQNPTIPELVLPLRDSFQPSDFDRVKQALILRETNLKNQNQILKETADLARLETVKLTDELNDLKKRVKKVSDEDKKVIQRLRSEKSRLEKQNLFLEVELKDCERRVSVLEDDISRLASQNGSVVNVENVEGSGKRIAELEQKHKFEMQKVEKEYAVLLSKHQLQLTEKVEVENKLKDCQVEMLKGQNEVNLLIENRRLLEVKYESEYKALEQKHQDDRLQLFKVENELKGLKEERNKLLEEVNKYKKHKDELSNFESQKEVAKNEPENGISRLEKFMSANHLGSKNVDKISKNNGMTNGSRNQNCTEIPKHAIDVENMCDSMPANVTPQRNAVGNSAGTSKSSYAEAIVLSDSDDDCDPGEPEPFGLKRKRTSSPNASGINNCGHHSEEESTPAEKKQRRMLGRCDFGNHNCPSTCDQEMSKKRPSIDSPAKMNDSSSSSQFSSDGSDDDGDINLLESTIRFITDQA